MLMKSLLCSLSTTLGILSSTLYASSMPDQEDSFAAYRDFSPDAAAPSERTLVHYSEADKLIEASLQKHLSKKEASILRALHWLIGFVDNNENFDSIAPYFFLLLHEMTASKGRVYQKRVAEHILKTSLTRAQKRLHKIYPNNTTGKNNFIGVLQILLEYPEYQAPYFEFYHRTMNFKSEPFDFEKAIKSNSYQKICEHLVSASFLHYYLTKTKNPIAGLPQDTFVNDLKKFEQFRYQLNYATESLEFVQLGYLATHVLLVLTNYGQFALPNSLDARRGADYIVATFNKAKSLGYLDLFAEYIQCLKMTHRASRTSISELEDFLYELQRPDGSWGTGQTLSSDPYTAFHPTWAVITALNQ